MRTPSIDLSRIKINPILNKEIKVQARSMKLAWGFLGYEAILTVIFLMTLGIMDMSSLSDYRSMITIFPVIGIAQSSMIAIMVPILTAGAIAGEKERQTFDILLTTPLSPFRIIFGKVLTCVTQVMFYIVGSIPLLAVAFIYGGLSWWILFLYIIVSIVYAFYLGSVGIFCSTISRKNTTCVVLAFVFYAITNMVSLCPTFFIALATDFEYVWEGPLLILMNPIVLLVEFFTYAMTGELLISDLGDSMSDRMEHMGVLSSFIFQEPLFTIMAIVCVIGISLLFMQLAASRIDPLRGSAYKNRTVSKKKV